MPARRAGRDEGLRATTQGIPWSVACTAAPDMATLHARTDRFARSRRSPLGPRRVAPLLVVALVVALAAMLGATACAFGLRGSKDDASVEVRNTADIGVNLYVLHRIGLKDNFLGQVGPKHSRRIR